MSRVFLSHSSRDAAVATAIANTFKAAEIDVWLDAEQIVLAGSIPRAMAGGIETSDRLLAA